MREIVHIRFVEVKPWCAHCAAEVDKQKPHRTIRENGELTYYHPYCWSLAGLSKPC